MLTTGRSGSRLLLFFLSALSFSLLIAGCGGTSASTSTPSPSGGGGGGGSGGGGSVSAPRVVSVSGGANVTGIDIAVVPKSGTAPNIEVLGVTSGSGGSAFNTGDQIHRGSTMTVLTFGKGMTSIPKVTISGPSDIAVNNIQKITAKDGTPGIAFTAQVDSGAKLGARTVRMVDSNNNITVFSGGLEVVP